MRLGTLTLVEGTLSTGLMPMKQCDIPFHGLRTPVLLTQDTWLHAALQSVLCGFVKCLEVP